MIEPVPTVIVVDDDVDMRSSLAALLTSMGLKVSTYGSGPELLECLGENHAGCAIIDYYLHGMDGLALYSQLRRRGCMLPVILISACLNVRKTAQAMESGVFRVLEKPFSDKELMDGVHQAMDQDRAARVRNHSAQDFAARLALLDPREQLTLELILVGHANKAIERKLSLSTRTVDRIRASILAKMQFLSFVELAAAYGAAGWTGPLERPSPMASGANAIPPCGP